MAKEIRLEWDALSLRVDEDEFQLIIMMLQDAGWTPQNNLKKVAQVARELINQGYEKSHARQLALMASGELRGFVRHLNC